MNTDDTANVPVKSVERAIKLVDTIQERNGATLSELADDLGAAKSTVHNHLLTLERHGYLVRDDDVFQIGFQFLDHGGFAREWKASYRFVRPKLHEIAQETNELCQFVVGQHNEGFVLFQARGTNAVETQSRIGSHGPLHSIPGGKAILAQFPIEAVRSFVEETELPTATSETITNPDELFTDLERTTERGYAVNRSEQISGLNGLSVPIQSANGDVLGALTVLGPSHRLNDDSTEQKISDRLLEAANELELNVTYSRV
jgi:DNA-binding IclR family transcriptional regulator